MPRHELMSAASARFRDTDLTQGVSARPAQHAQRGSRFGFGDQLVHPIGKGSVALGSRMLVSQRRRRRRVAEPAHELAGARSGRRDERVGEVPQVVEVKVGRPARSRAARQIGAQFERRGVAPLAPVNTSASKASSTNIARCASSSGTRTVGSATVRSPARDFGGPSTRAPSTSTSCRSTWSTRCSRMKFDVTPLVGVTLALGGVAGKPPIRLRTARRGGGGLIGLFRPMNRRFKAGSQRRVPICKLLTGLDSFGVQSYKKSCPVVTTREEITSHVDAYRPVP
jgi:hypothetical protein